jgi:protein-disulfide isomerase
MRPFWLALLSIGFVAAVVLVFFVVRLRPITPAPGPAPIVAGSVTKPTVTFVNPSDGNPKAKVTIVEFADFQCGPCAQLNDSLSAVSKTYPDDVRVVWKDFPDEAAHPLATEAAVAAHCAGAQGQFWAYHDALFARQSFLSAGEFDAIATALKLDTAAFDACLSSADAMLPVVQHDADEAKGLGLTATPTLFVNGVKVIGAPTTDELLGYVRNALQAAK